MDTAKLCGKKLDLRSYLFLLIYFFCLIQGIQSLKDVDAVVPNAVKVHETITLQCKFDLEGQPLYTVKWYKGIMEFFRYIPKEDPSFLVFEVPGVNVDLSRSTPNEVVLMDIQAEATGRYKCEVSTDAPDFYTTMASGYMYVIDVPEEAPVMEISKDIIGNSHIIRAKCTTPPSFPPMNVTWYLNGIKVNESSRRSVSLDPVLAYTKNRRAPFMTISQMEKEIDDNVFQSGAIKVQCIGTLFNFYKSENVRHIEDNRIKPWTSSVIGASENAAGFSVLSLGALMAASLAVSFW